MFFFTAQSQQNLQSYRFRLFHKLFVELISKKETHGFEKRKVPQRKTNLPQQNKPTKIRFNSRWRSLRVIRVPKNETRADGIDTRADEKGRRADEIDTRADEKGRRADGKGIRADEKGRRADGKGTRADEKGRRADEKGTRADGKGTRADGKGRRADEKGTRADEKDTTVYKPNQHAAI